MPTYILRQKDAQSSTYSDYSGGVDIVSGIYLNIVDLKYPYPLYSRPGDAVSGFHQSSDGSPCLIKTGVPTLNIWYGLAKKRKGKKKELAKSNKLTKNRLKIRILP